MKKLVAAKKYAKKYLSVGLAVSFFYCRFGVGVCSVLRSHRQHDAGLL